MIYVIDFCGNKGVGGGSHRRSTVTDVPTVAGIQRTQNHENIKCKGEKQHLRIRPCGRGEGGAGGTR